MSIDAAYNRALTYAALSFSASATISSNAATPFSESLAAAKTGTLTTRTNGTDGTLTMDAGHGFTTGQRLDIYWSGGSCYGATIGTVATNSVPFTGAQGTALPVATTAITAMVPTSVAVAVVGNNAVSIGVGCPVGGNVIFADSGNATLAAVVLTSSVTSYVWTSAYGGTNPLAGATVAKVFISHGLSTAASVIIGLVQFN
jgi:hypothetical protein